MNRALFFVGATLVVLSAFPASAQTLADARKAYIEKQFEKALTILESLKEKNPEEATVFLLLGHTAVRLERWEAAIAAFERAGALEPKSVAPYIQLGFLREKTKNPRQAKEAWQRVLELAQDEKTKKMAQKHLNNLKDE